MRGSLKVTIKLQFIGNDNPFRDSSAGVQFFTASTLSPTCFIIQEVIGFVVDLVVEDDDPESSWQDYFRANNKSSNDNRLKILHNLSAEVRREVGKKVLELGGNAVIGYSSHFDIESGLVARAYGTACRLLKVDDRSSMIAISADSSDVVTKNPLGCVVELPSVMKSRSYHGAEVIAVDSEMLSARGNVALSDGLARLYHVKYVNLAQPTDIGTGRMSHNLGNSTSRQTLYPLATALIQFGGAADKSIMQGSLRGGADWNESEVKLLSMASFGEHTKMRLGESD
jgi:hypothetical protein